MAQLLDLETASDVTADGDPPVADGGKTYTRTGLGGIRTFISLSLYLIYKRTEELRSHSDPELVDAASKPLPETITLTGLPLSTGSVSLNSN